MVLPFSRRTQVFELQLGLLYSLEIELKSMASEEALHAAKRFVCISKPRNLRQFDGIKGGRKRVLVIETVFHAFRGAQPLFHAPFGVKTLSGTLLEPAFIEHGLRC